MTKKTSNKSHFAIFITYTHPIHRAFLQLCVRLKCALCACSDGDALYIQVFRYTFTRMRHYKYVWSWLLYHHTKKKYFFINQNTKRSLTYLLRALSWPSVSSLGFVTFFHYVILVQYIFVQVLKNKHNKKIIIEFKAREDNLIIVKKKNTKCKMAVNECSVRNSRPNLLTVERFLLPQLK